MGFGSYDESEQERQEVDTDDIDEDGVKSGDAHEGEVEFEGMDDTDTLLDRLNDIKDGEA